MRAFRHRRLLVLCVMAMTLAVGSAAYAHLPKAVAVQTEGGTRKVLTYGATVADVLKQAGLTVRAYDRVRPGLTLSLETGMTIKVRRAFPVTLFADGKPRPFMTAAATVAEFLTESGVALRSQDQVSPVLETTLRPDALIRVVRVETHIVATEERLPFARIAKLDPTLPRGMTRLVQTGRPGSRVRRIAVTTADGVVVDRQVVSDVRVRSPQDQILQVGTRRIIASRGEFAGKEILRMEATAYAPWNGRGVNDITATGLKAGYGVVAVDPSVIPLGSKLFIEGYGPAIAGDTGGAIKGQRIDLCFNTAREAVVFGRRQVRVYILSSPVIAGR
jgi:3D (Asp-Asp-Asp) domain-containing protein